MPLSPTRLITCTACGAVLPVGEERIGKKCRCGRCGKVSVVGGDAPRRRSQKSAELNKFHSFPCRICQTNLSARAQDVGRKAKCPDCGALTEVPEPPKPRPKVTPKAMHGEQYGLWGVDEAPSPAELAARQPKFFPVFCRVCNTLMHARAEQVGKKLACPDCGAKTTVKEPPKPKPKKSVLVPDGDEYQLDSADALRVPPQPQVVQAPQPVETKRAELAPIRQERSERPQLPLLPTVQGVLRMLIRNPVFTWFLILNLIGLSVGIFMNIAVSMNPLAAIPFFIGAGITFLLGLGATAAMCLAVLIESSEGNDRLHNPPGPIFLDWVGDLFYLLMPTIVAISVAVPLGGLLEQQLLVEQSGLTQVVIGLLLFPLLLLSCSENSSPMAIYSPRIFASVTKRPLHWLIFYLESAAILWGSLMAAEGLALGSTTLALLTIPVFVATLLLYFRILGRLAWWLAESLAVDANEE